MSARHLRALFAALATLVIVSGGCRQAQSPTPSVARAAAPAPSGAGGATPETDVLRVTGTIQALQSLSVRVPQISGQNSRVTLTTLIPNGSKVKAGDTLVEFDRTALLDEERDAVAKLAETQSQLDEKRAQILNDAAKRASLIKDAEADLGKAQIQLRKGPILSEIDRLKNESKAKSSRARLDSLKKSDGYRQKAEAASVRILELKLERQKVTIERIRSNMSRLIVKSPQDGMVALENIWKSGSMGPPQEGDQLWPGQPVLRVFDPTRMIVDAMVNEPDIASVNKLTKARLYLDAYPGAVFDAELESASPVATAGLESPVRTFSARFRVLGNDARLLPDLSAALEVPRVARVTTTSILPVKDVTP